MTAAHEHRPDCFDWLLALGWVVAGLVSIGVAVSTAHTSGVPRSFAAVPVGYGALCLATSLAMLRRWRSSLVLGAVSAVLLGLLSVLVIFVFDIQAWAKLAVAGPGVVLASWTGVEVAFGQEE